MQRELEEFGAAGKDERSMAWATADLLSWSSIQRCIWNDEDHSIPCDSHATTIDHGDSIPPTIDSKFFIVIEKSCADAIACGEDVKIPIPYNILTTGVSNNEVAAQHGYIHPVCLLAIHVAALTEIGGFWIILSYTKYRFGFLFGVEDEDESMVHWKIDGSVPDPRKLWTMLSWQEI